MNYSDKEYADVLVHKLKQLTNNAYLSAMRIVGLLSNGKQILDVTIPLILIGSNC